MQIHTYVALYVTVVDFTAFLGVLTYVPLYWAKCHKIVLQNCILHVFKLNDSKLYSADHTV